VDCIEVLVEEETDLESEDFRLDEVEGFAVDFDEAFAFFAVGDCCCWGEVSDLFLIEFIAA
jgi:hypothetical protein